MHMSICTLCEKSSVRAAEKRFIQLSNRKNIVTTTRAENLATGNASDRSGLHSAPALFAGVVAKHLRLNAKMLSIVVMPGRQKSYRQSVTDKSCDQKRHMVEP